MQKSIAFIGVLIGALLAYLASKGSKTKLPFTFNRSTFADALGQMESSNNYTIENSIGALGKYQFMPSTLNDLMNRYSLPDWNPKENFLSNPELQESYFQKHLDNILGTISKDSAFENYVGTITSGRKRFQNLAVPANYYGFTAGCHLAGIGGCRKFVLGIKDSDDGRTAVSDYVAYFSNQLS